MPVGRLTWMPDLRRYTFPRHSALSRRYWCALDCTKLFMYGVFMSPRLESDEIVDGMERDAPDMTAASVCPDLP